MLEIDLSSVVEQFEPEVRCRVFLEEVNCVFASRYCLLECEAINVTNLRIEGLGDALEFLARTIPSPLVRAVPEDNATRGAEEERKSAKERILATVNIKGDNTQEMVALCWEAVREVESLAAQFGGELYYKDLEELPTFSTVWFAFWRTSRSFCC